MKKKIESKYDSLSVILGQMTMCHDVTNFRGRKEKLIEAKIFYSWIQGITQILKVKVPRPKPSKSPLE